MLSFVTTKIPAGVSTPPEYMAWQAGDTDDDGGVKEEALVGYGPTAFAAIADLCATLDNSATMRFMPLESFVDLGYLQEVNRQFLHPLGLALQVKRDDEGEYTLSGIVDARFDPEGMVFDDSELDPVKRNHVTNEWVTRANAREKSLGFAIQPIPEGGDES